MSVLYQSDGDASLNDGIAMMETTVDPATAPNGVTYTGTYSWLGTSDPNAMNAQIFTVWVQ